jgi:hypothetical protein
LDRIDGLPSIHWVPDKGEPVRSYEEVMRTRASRDELVRPEIAPLERLENRFIELAAQQLPKRKKTKAARKKIQRPGRKSVESVGPNPDGPKCLEKER